MLRGGDALVVIFCEREERETEKVYTRLAWSIEQQQHKSEWEKNMKEGTAAAAIKEIEAFCCLTYIAM